MTPATIDRIIQIASDVLDVPVERLTPHASPNDIAAWDSVQHLILIMAVEERFHLHFAPEDIDEMVSLERIASLVERQLSARPTGDGSTR